MKNECTNCYLNTGFRHKFFWYDAHIHTKDGIVFKYDLATRIALNQTEPYRGDARHSSVFAIDSGGSPSVVEAKKREQRAKLKIVVNPEYEVCLGGES